MCNLLVNMNNGLGYGHLMYVNEKIYVNVEIWTYIHTLCLYVYYETYT